MQWPNFWFSSLNDSDDQSKLEAHSHNAEELKSTRQETISNLELTNPPLITSLTQPTTLLSTALLTTTLLTLYTLQRRFLRRIPTATALPQTYILPSTRRLSRSLFGHVTSVGDADNFRLFHTPLGRLGLWGILRKIPDDAKSLKNNTIHIRLAGIDAPELAHFGRPAQPYSKEALDWLTTYLRGRRVRCYVHKADQYSRVVATVYIRKGLLRRDVGLQMLKAGLATMYESKGGAEFSGIGVEEKYKAAEAWAKRKRKGMWRDKGKLETPREYKNRYRDAEGTNEA